MTEQEFKAWANATRRDAGWWTVDRVHNGRNGNRVLAYCGRPDDPAAGVYVAIDPTVRRGALTGTYTLTAGRYQGAMPHIGEALFKPTTVVDGLPSIAAGVCHAAGALKLPVIAEIVRV
jgi:hypothetical protein